MLCMGWMDAEQSRVAERSTSDNGAAWDSGAVEAGWIAAMLESSHSMCLRPWLSKADVKSVWGEQVGRSGSDLFHHSCSRHCACRLHSGGCSSMYSCELCCSCWLAPDFAIEQLSSLRSDWSAAAFFFFFSFFPESSAGREKTHEETTHKNGGASGRISDQS